MSIPNAESKAVENDKPDAGDGKPPAKLKADKVSWGDKGDVKPTKYPPDTHLFTPNNSKAGVWKHVSKAYVDLNLKKESDWAVCNQCKPNAKGILKHCGNTTNAKKHLDLHHAGWNKKKPEAGAGEQKKVPNTKEAIQQSFLDSLQAARRKQELPFDLHVAKWLCQDLRPLSIVKDKGLHAALDVACSYMHCGCGANSQRKLKLPSVDTAKARLTQIYDAVKELVKLKLQAIKNLAYTVDLWTAVNNHGFIGVTLHYIDENWELQSACLGIGRVTRTSSSASPTAATTSSARTSVLLLPSGEQRPQESHGGTRAPHRSRPQGRHQDPQLLAVCRHLQELPEVDQHEPCSHRPAAHQAAQVPQGHASPLGFDAQDGQAVLPAARGGFDGSGPGCRSARSEGGHPQGDA